MMQLAILSNSAAWLKVDPSSSEAAAQAKARGVRNFDWAARRVAGP